MSDIQWAIDGFCRRLKDKEENRSPAVNRRPKKSIRLKLCPKCLRVWETSCTGACVRYNHLPTLRLKRVICTFCEGKGRPYKER